MSELGDLRRKLEQRDAEVARLLKTVEAYERGKQQSDMLAQGLLPCLDCQAKRAELAPQARTGRAAGGGAGDAPRGAGKEGKAMKTYLCWCPDMGEEPDDGEEVTARDAALAAERYAEAHFSDWSYPRECEVLVQEPPAPAVRVRVDVETVPSFSGTIVSGAGR